MRGSEPLLDVRSAAEFRAGHVPGAQNVPFWQLAFRAPAPPAAPDAPLVVYCGHGPRARIAAAILRRRGFRHVSLLAGHMAGWLRKGLPVETGTR